MDIRQDPDNPNRIAVRTGPGITAGPWLLFDLNNGGCYASGVDEGVEQWPLAQPASTEVGA